MPRVTLTLLPEEQGALIKLALSELRTPRDQARMIVRQELVKRGLLSSITAGSVAQPQEQNQEVHHETDQT